METDTDLSPTKSSMRSSSRERKTIKWSEWNPFQRATGEALKQLNKRQRKQPTQPDESEALL